MTGDSTLAASLLGVVDRFGYLGVAGLVFIESFGVPAPGETAILAGATYAGQGHLNVIVVALVAFLAAVTGDSLGYLIGRTGGRPLVLRFGRYVRLTPARLTGWRRSWPGTGRKLSWSPGSSKDCGSSTGSWPG
jgi:membrane protein DedA with SNARE-associated domain